MGPPRGKKRALGEHSPGHEITDLNGENVNGNFAGFLVECKEDSDESTTGEAGEAGRREALTYYTAVSLDIRGTLHKYGLTRLTHGSNNVVLSIQKATDTYEKIDIPGVLIRIEGSAPATAPRRVQ